MRRMMMAMKTPRPWGLLLPILALLGWACGPTEETRVPDTVADGRLVLPEGDGRPVLLDGLFSTGEWEDATAVPVGDAFTLHFKHYRGFVFVGVEVHDLTIPVVDLYVRSGDGPIRQLHASAQLGERELSAVVEDTPPFRWGLTRDWYANEVRMDRVSRDSLESAGVDPTEAILRTLVPYDGFEMQLRRSKVPGSQWRVRIEVHSGAEHEAPYVYPAQTSLDDTEDWLVLVLPPEAAG
jgi:hypothetical protein